MGTKNNPGKYDCKAEPDEPMFVLLARDPQAQALVTLWANYKEREGEDPAKVAEARQCAANMRAWLEASRECFKCGGSHRRGRCPAND